MNSLNHTALETLVKLQVAAQHTGGGTVARDVQPRVADELPDEEGSTTVEYAIGAVATAAFAGLLLAVLKSGGVRSMLNNIIQTALSV